VRSLVRSSVAAVLAAGIVLVALGPTPAAAAPGPPGVPQWWFDEWDVPALWAGGARGQGIVIAEIDSGVNADLPELAGKVLAGRDFGDPTQDGRTDQDLEAFGHGTAMASLMVAEPGDLGITGLAPDARVLPVAIPLLGTATEGSTSVSLPLAIRWAVDHGGQIISLSLGQERQEGTDPLACPTAEQDAILYAIGKGAIVVAASGNEGESGSPVTDPGVCIGVVAVGAVDVDDEVASFSSRHSYLTVTAPGVDPDPGPGRRRCVHRSGHQPGDGDRVRGSGADLVEVPRPHEPPGGGAHAGDARTAGHDTDRGPGVRLRHPRRRSVDHDRRPR